MSVRNFIFSSELKNMSHITLLQTNLFEIFFISVMGVVMQASCQVDNLIGTRLFYRIYLFKKVVVLVIEL